MVKHAAPSKKQDRILIDESDRLLFTKYKEQDPWQPNSTKYIRLRPTRFEKLGFWSQHASSSFWGVKGSLEILKDPTEENESLVQTVSVCA